MIKIYLDNCCFNRPYDDQNQIRIMLETEAKLYIQEEIRNGNLDFVWSYALVYENNRNSNEAKKEEIEVFAKRAIEFCQGTEEIYKLAENIMKSGIKELDALHIACAITSKCDYFITVDDGILKRKADGISIVDPTTFIRLWEVEKNGK